MQIMVRPRQAGKTYAMVQWALAGEPADSYPFWTRVILTPDLQQADYIRSQYPALDYRQVFSWREWRERVPGRGDVQVAVDNAEMVLAQAIGQYASFVTMTGGEE